MCGQSFSIFFSLLPLLSQVALLFPTALRSLFYQAVVKDTSEAVVGEDLEGPCSGGSLFFSTSQIRRGVWFLCLS